ncbi:hypothetical protein VN21_04525, partial [Paraclostridium benzoelyticum]
YREKLNLYILINIKECNPLSENNRYMNCCEYEKCNCNKCEKKEYPKKEINYCNQNKHYP